MHAHSFQWLSLSISIPITLNVYYFFMMRTIKSLFPVSTCILLVSIITLALNRTPEHIHQSCANPGISIYCPTPLHFWVMNLIWFFLIPFFTLFISYFVKENFFHVFTVFTLRWMLIGDRFTGFINIFNKVPCLSWWRRTFKTFYP